MENGNGNSTGETLDELKARYAVMNERIDRRIAEVQAETLKIREGNAQFREMVSNLERRVDLVEYTQDRDEDRLVRVEDVGPTLINMLSRQEERLDLQRLEYKVRQQELEDKLKEMAEAQKQASEAQTEAQKRYTEAGQQTEERLNAFIVVLESYIQESQQRRNGNGNGDH